VQLLELEEDDGHVIVVVTESWLLLVAESVVLLVTVAVFVTDVSVHCAQTGMLKTSVKVLESFMERLKGPH
jgi:hypothetical protein